MENVEKYRGSNAECLCDVNDITSPREFNRGSFQIQNKDFALRRVRIEFRLAHISALADVHVRITERNV